MTEPDLPETPPTDPAPVTAPSWVAPASTPEEHTRQIVNIALNNLAARLRTIRKLRGRRGWTTDQTAAHQRAQLDHTVQVLADIDDVWGLPPGDGLPHTFRSVKR